MKKLFLLGVLAISASITGLGRGWFQVAPNADGDSSKITVIIDKTKIQADKERVMDKAHDVGQRLLAAVDRQNAR
jgi:hypothetical protein